MVNITVTQALPLKPISRVKPLPIGHRPGGDPDPTAVTRWVLSRN